MGKFEEQVINAGVSEAMVKHVYVSWENTDAVETGKIVMKD